MALLQTIQERFNEDLYWRKRFYVQNHNNLIGKFLLITLRRTENSQCASTGLGLNTKSSPMCIMDGRLILPHRLNGIIIARNVHIGKNVTIFQHVTIAEENKAKTTVIEDGAVIGVDSVILNNSRIGKNARIGANAVVTHDIAEGGIAVGVPARLISETPQRQEHNQ